MLVGATPPALPVIAQNRGEALTIVDPEYLREDHVNRICAPFLQNADFDDDRAGYGRGRGYAQQVPSTVSPPPPPPPAPPPPPPPPPLSADRATEARENVSRAQPSAPAVVTGNRIAQPGMIPPRPPYPYPYPGTENRERYDGEDVASIVTVADQPVSTFGVDVDTGSYSNVRRMLTGGDLPPRDAVRTEEMLNYFRYDYPNPRDRSRPFTLTTDMTTTPWNAESRLLRIGLRGYDLPRGERPPANLVFLVDVSGSMNSMDKLPLVQCSMALLAEQLGPRDRVSLVTYAGHVQQLLDGSSNREEIIRAIGMLRSGGSTAGASGIEMAYNAARKSMIDDGINRVILATDGDFNVGVTNTDQLIQMVEQNRESGITLTTLGFGTGNFNEAMMEQIADHGNGNYAYIDTAMEAQRVLVTELSSTLFTIAHDVKLQIEFNPAWVREYRLIGYENRLLAEEDFDNDAVDAGDIGAGHQVTALYEIVPAEGTGWLPRRRYDANRPAAPVAGGAELAWLRLRYKLPGQDNSRLIEQPVAAGLIRSARAPAGDMAFIAAVAAYGQRLRADRYLGDYGFADIRRLASTAYTGDYWRREFLRLAEMAEQQTAALGSANGKDGGK
ncbi:MAG: VWA domain-containing protein [Sphingomonadaceae bacterium]|nr:VWA domain-containing protein [Sphingomonadaceae bacterium]